MVKYSIFIPFVREWAVAKWFNNFLAMDLDRSQTELIIYLDSNSVELKTKILNYFNDLGNFQKVHIYCSNKSPLQDTEWQERRARIIEMREQSKDFINGQYIFSIEDDTLCPLDTFRRLMKGMRKDVGFIQGAEVGRWGYRNVGAWRYKEEKSVNFIKEEIVEIESLPVGQGLEEIDSGGLYCFISPAKVYKKCRFYQDGVLGPDMNYGREVKKQGLKNLIDWNVKCIHIQKDLAPLEVKNIDVIKWSKTFNWRKV